MFRERTVEYWAKLVLLDECGKPFSAHVDGVLRDLAPRLRRQFAACTDEVVLAEVLEEAGRKIVNHERQSGPIEKLHGYAWVTVWSVATTRMRRSSMRIARATLDAEESDVALHGLASNLGTAEHIEANILVSQLRAQMTPEEQLLCTWKQWGFSSREIARAQGTSVERVNTAFHRMKQKIRDIVRGRQTAEPGSPQTAQQRARTRTA